MADTELKAIVTMEGVDDGVAEMLEDTVAALEQADAGSEGLTRTYKDMNAQLKSMRSELKTAQSAYRDMVLNGQEGSQAALECAQSIKEQESAISSMESEMDAAAQAVRDLSNADLEQIQAMGKLKTEIEQQKSQMKDLCKAYEDAAKAYGENSDEAQKLKEEIDKLADAIDDNESALKKEQESAEEAASSSEDLADALDEAGNAAGSSESRFSALSVTLGNLAAEAIKTAASAIWDFGKESVETGMNFEKSMSKVAALSGASSGELEALTAKAKEYGSTTQFTASEAADALGYMALAGWDANQSMEALPGVLNLAASSGMDLANASDVVTDYLSAFGMEASQAGEMVDMMAYAQANSNTSAQQLADAWKNCAATLNGAGQGVSTVTSFLEAMANQGYKGSEAGTAMAAVMRDITNSMENGAIKIGETSIAVRDSEGNFLNLIDIMRQVEQAVDGMGTAERTAALSSTFTADSQKAVNFALAEGVDKIAGYKSALEDCDGAAKEMADTMNDNLAGDWASFNSALEGVQLAIYDLVEPALRTLTSLATEAAHALQGAIEWIGNIKLPSGMGEMLGSIALIGTGIAAGIGVGKVAVNAWNKLKALNPFQKTEGEVQSSTSKIGNLTQGLGNGIKSALEGVSSVAKGIGEAISTALQGAGTAIQSVLAGFSMMGIGGMVAFAGVVGTVTVALITLAACQDLILPFLQGLADIVVSLSAVFPPLGEAIGNCAPVVEALGTAFEGLGQGLQSVLEGVGSVVESIGSGIRSVLEGIASVVESVGTSMLNAGRGVDKFADGLTKISKLSGWELIGKLTEIGIGLGQISKYSEEMKSFGDGFESFGNGLDSIAKSAKQALESMQSIVEMSGLVTEAFESMQGAGDKLDTIKATLSEGLGAISDVMTDKFANLAPKITETSHQLSEAFNNMEIELGTSADSIKGKLEDIYNAIDGIAKASSSISELEGAAEKIKSFAQGLKNLEEVDAGSATANVRQISTALRSVADMADGLTSAGAGIKALGDGLKIIGECAQTAVSGLNNIVEAKGKLEEAISFLEGLGERITGVTNDLSVAFAGMSDTVNSQFPPVADKVIEVSDTISSALDSIGTDAQGASEQMANICSSIQGSLDGILSASSQMENVQSTMTNAMEQAYTNIQASLDMINAAFTNGLSTVQSTVQTAFNGVVNTIRSKMSEAVSAVSSGVTSMRNALNVTLQGPKISIPKISVSSKSVSYGDGQSTSIPDFSVSYTTMAKGGILDSATLLGMVGGHGYIAGEAGPEAVIPIERLFREMKAMILAGLEAKEMQTRQNRFTGSVLGRNSEQAVGTLFTPNTNVNISYSSSPIQIQIDGNPSEKTVQQIGLTVGKQNQVSEERLARLIRQVLMEEQERAYA